MHTLTLRVCNKNNWFFWLCGRVRNRCNSFCGQQVIARCDLVQSGYTLVTRAYPVAAVIPSKTEQWRRFRQRMMVSATRLVRWATWRFYWANEVGDVTSYFLRWLTSFDVVTSAMNRLHVTHRRIVIRSSHMPHSNKAFSEEKSYVLFALNRFGFGVKNNANNQ